MSGINTANGYSPDGFIIDQRRTGAHKFGAFGSQYNGCGWIAVYNLLRATGKPVFPAEVIARLEPSLQLKGLIGTRIRSMKDCLASFGYWAADFRGREQVLQALRRAQDGIVWYMDGLTPHFAAFCRVSTEGKPLLLRFFNAEAGRTMHVCAPEEFVGRKKRLALLTSAVLIR